MLQQQFGLGENIARQRKMQGLTQDALGALLGVSAQAVSKWERQLACPDIMLLPSLAAVLGVTLDQLFAPCSPTVVPVRDKKRAVS
ncbi:MAG: helix-turn-helix transcriptional regulator [Eubacteriales bacterium]|nr:helix-turn-helix transcriptional regulator [Eubacteriales bacterium]MDY4898032.1 helix-turn-helix transcriptional regulator [Eubacteriales bacterium]